jgi:hypothetical protein
MISVPQDTIVSLCRKHGPSLKLSSGLDGVRLMWAIAGAESSFGADCTPRHENAYDVGGFYYQHSPSVRALIKSYGSAGASSYGPWQVLLVNAPNFTPSELQADPDKCAQAFVCHMNIFVLGFRGARTLEQIAQTYNSGNFYPNPSPEVLRYVDKVRNYYDRYHVPDNAG